MTPNTSITAEQTVGTNLGRMVAIEAGAIKGDIYVERISQVQITSLTPEGREANADRFINVSTLPYLSLYPYTASDEALFRGRNKEIQRIVEAMHGQRLLVVYGHAGVGKTSLLAAGAIPALAREGALAILVQDYLEPEKTILEGLALGAESLAFDLPEESSLSVLLDKIIKEVKGTLVLVLDQFELLFEPTISEELRTKFIGELAEALRTIDGNMLRIIIVTRSESLEKLGELESQLPRLLQCPIQLLPMTRTQALSAIEEPLYVVKPQTKTIFEGNLAKDQLLPDLDELTANEPDFIQPQHLQIVCDELYRNATTLGQVRVITSELYTRELKGAEGILASFMRRMLQTHVDENQQDCALQILAIMASPGAERWMKPTDFDLKDIDNAEIESILDKLVDARLLIRAYSSGKLYCLVSQMITRELRRLSGTGKQVEERYNAEDELERIWNTWLALEHYASREQLRYLVRCGDHLDPRAVKTLLMLRSAVEADEDARIWLGRLRGSNHDGQGEENAEGRRLIKQLETNGEVAGDQRIGRAMLVNAKRLLGFAEQELADGLNNSQPPEEDGESSFGAVAQTAVSAALPSIRQTCAIALAAVEPALAASRLKAALRKVEGSRRRRLLRSELFGSLADADPEVAKLNSELPLLQRIFIWNWRARRRVSRDSRRLAWLTLGGAIGAGLGVGLLQAWAAIPPDGLPGQEFWIYFFLAGILGAALSFGTALGQSLQPPQSNDPADQPASFGSKLRFLLLSVALGTFFFGIVHSILYLLNHRVWIGANYIILMGFAAGLGMSIALSISVAPIRLPTSVRWIIRLAAAATTFILIDQFFVTVSQHTAGVVLMTQISESRDQLRELLTLDNPPLRLRLFTGLSNDPQILAILHAVLIGFFMIIGLTLGLAQANRSFQKRQTKIRQP